MASNDPDNTQPEPLSVKEQIELDPWKGEARQKLLDLMEGVHDLNNILMDQYGPTEEEQTSGVMNMPKRRHYNIEINIILTIIFRHLKTVRHNLGHLVFDECWKDVAPGDELEEIAEDHGLPAGLAELFGPDVQVIDMSNLSLEEFFKHGLTEEQKDAINRARKAKEN